MSIYIICLCIHIYRIEGEWSRCVEREREMERWKGWIWFYFKISFFLPTKAILVKVASCHKDKTEGSKHHNLGIHFFALGCFLQLIIRSV